MKNTSSSHSRTRNRSFTMIIGVLAFIVVFAVGSLGATESPDGIEVRTTHQKPIFFGAAAAQTSAVQSSSVSGSSWLKSRDEDDVELIDRDEFLGEVEANLTTRGFSERVDPFSGSVHLNMVDLVLPGNGGLDIVVQRYYNSQVWNRVDNPDPLIARHTPSVDLNGHLGESGWQLHMGKLINVFPGTDQYTTLIMSDGSTHTLYDSDGYLGEEKKTPEGWVYSMDGFVHTVQTTTGLKYFFDQVAPGADFTYLGLAAGTSPIKAIQCTRIEDLNGNAIVIEYSDFHYPGLGYGWGNRIERISFDDSNDSREVVFTYHVDDYEETPTNIIEHMKLMNDDTAIETWTFNYVGAYQVDHLHFPYVDWVFVNELGYVSHSITGDYVNESITNPWQFTYYDDTTPLTQGKRLIKDVISPRIGKITYTWDAKVMETGGESCGGVQFLAIDTRTVAVGISPNPIVYENETTTNYTYTNPGREDGSTSIVTTDSQTSTVLATKEHVFHGWILPYDEDDEDMWKVGRQKSSTFVLKDDVGDDFETTTTTTVWEQGSQFSSDSRWSSLWLGCGSSREFGPQSYVKPTSVTRVVERHDSIPDPPPTPIPDPDWYQTVSSVYDDYGNVGLVTELSDDGLSRTTNFTYWQYSTNNIMVGRIQGQDANPGGAQCFVYDTIGRVTSSYENPQTDDVLICEPTRAIVGGRQTDFTYDGDGNLYTQTEISANNRVTTHTNYVFGKPTETTIATGTRADIHYCRDYKPRGMVAWETDGRGCSSDYRTVYEYDFLGRRTSADPPLSEAIAYDYPTPSSIQALVTRGDRVMDYRFDRIGSGNLTAIYKHIGTTPTTTQLFAVTNDALGRRRQVQQQWNTRLGDHFSYDPLGRPTTITHPGTPTTMVTLDYAGSSVTVTDENNHITDYVYHAFGDPNDRRLYSLTDAGNFTTIYGYDTVFGNLNSVDAPITQGDRSFTYYSNSAVCNNGFLSEESHPESGTTTYGYNCLGDITTRTREGTEITTYDYDHAGRLTGILYSGTASDVDIGYDQASRRTSLSNDFASATFGYDDAGRLQTATQSIFGGPQSQATSYAYDTLDRLKTITYPSTRVVTYGWNDDNWLTSVTGADGSGVEYLSGLTHHVTGAVDLVTFGNTVTTDHGIDDRNRLSSIVTTAPGGQPLNVTLGYDAVSNLTSWDDNLGPNLDRTFGYDDLDRLTSATSANLWGSLSYAYDELGNREERVLESVTTTYVYDSNNRLTDLTGGNVRSFTYDDVGRLATENRSAAKTRSLRRLQDEIFSDGFESGDTSAWDFMTVPTGVFSYTFNEADQLVSVTNGTAPVGDYAYDGDGYRVSKGLGSLFYIRDSAGNTLAEYDDEGELIAEYIYANGRQVAKVMPDGASGFDFRFFHADHLGSALSITDGVGTLKWVGEYFPFGSEFSSTGEVDRYRFTQHELDIETDLLYAKARYYHPDIGRFISTDPVGGSVGSSQSWNRYAYVENNPLIYTDPTGEFLDTILDVGFIIYDVGVIINDNILGGTTEGLGTNLAALGGDVVGAAIPFATGGGAAVRGGVKLANKADSLVDSARTIDNAGDASRGTDFIVNKAGESIAIPNGAVGPKKPKHGKGMVYDGGSGGHGMNDRVTGVRVMDANQHQGRRMNYMNKGGQTVDPATGRTISNSDPRGHVPVKEPMGE